jgi:hypothetical protein
MRRLFKYLIESTGKEPVVRANLGVIIIGKELAAINKELMLLDDGRNS